MMEPSDEEKKSKNKNSFRHDSIRFQPLSCLCVIPLLYRCKLYLLYHKIEKTEKNAHDRSIKI